MQSLHPPDQYTPKLAKAIALSDELIDEFFAADRYVPAVPMYNFSIPAGLKSYIDHIVRPKRMVDEQGYKDYYSKDACRYGLVVAIFVVLVQH